MTTQNTANRPLWVDYKHAGASKPRRQRAPRGIGMSARSKPTMGAVRLSADAAPRFRHGRKTSAGLLLIAGGILITTTSTGTVDKTKPTMAMLSIASPTFFFNDAHDALGDKRQLVAGSGDKKNILSLASVPEQPATAIPAAYHPQGADATEQVLRDLDSLTPDTFGQQTPKTVTLSTMVDHPAVAAVRQKAESPEGSTEEKIKIASGDNLSRLLNDRGVKIEQMPQLLTDDVVKKYLTNLRIGQELSIVRLANGDFHSMSTRVGKDRRITIRRSSAGFAVASIDLPVEKERVVTSGTIDQSLYIAAEQANLKQSTIMELSDIFQWELDFARDIRKGDEFSLVYDRLYREGKYIGDGDILAAEFVRGGKHYRAVRFTDAEGNTDYYSPDGRSKRRTFLRHPVDVVRITSRFNPNRKHPVLHKIRAHRGVDYGSPPGTPIRATANGVVGFAGNKSAYGKTVTLKHGTDIRTLYAHMSRISKKIKSGKRVKQGDVIGYVGATGRVTGPHLHYEFQKNGKHVDPLKVELPAAEPLAKQYRDELRALSDDLIAQMRSVLHAANEQVASAQ